MSVIRTLPKKLHILWYKTGNGNRWLFHTKEHHDSHKKEESIWARNTPILQEIIDTLSTELDDTAYALDRLENISMTGCWRISETSTSLARTPSNCV